MLDGAILCYIIYILIIMNTKSFFLMVSLTWFEDLRSEGVTSA